MRNVLILMAGGVLGYLAKAVIDEMKWPLIVNTTTGQEGQRVPPSVFKDTADTEPVKPDHDF